MTDANKETAPTSTDPSTYLSDSTWTGNWALDPSRSSLHFESTSLWGLVKVRGGFTGLRGHGTVSPDGTVVGQLEVDAASVDTQKEKRDTHLRSGDFFEAEHHPTITYTVSSVTPTGPGRARVAGQLTIRKHVEPLELDAALEEADPAGVTLDASTTVDRSAWGIDFRKLGMTKMATNLEARLRFVRAS
jgi:polyisoprenoid-binding protein YceI